MHLASLAPLLLAGALGRLEPSTAIDLLGGRLVVTMPSGAKAESRGHGIMSADAPAENETRVVLDAGEERLVVMANDLFATAGDDFASSVKAEAGLQGNASDYDVAVATAGKGLSAVSVMPRILDRSGDAVLVESYCVMTADGLVETVAVYVNPPAAADLDGAKLLADKILRSLAAGARTLPRAGGRTKVTDLDATRDLYADLPQDVVVSLQRGIDFDVAHLRPLRTLGAGGRALGIYVGHHASFRTDSKARTVADTVLGKRVRWQMGSGDDQPTADALVRIREAGTDGDGIETMVHLFARAPDEASLEKVRVLARSLTLVKR
jgi:hypothetical protein